MPASTARTGLAAVCEAAEVDLGDQRKRSAPTWLLPAVVVAAAVVGAVAVGGGVLIAYVWAMGSAHEELFVHDQLIEDPELVALLREQCRRLEADLDVQTDAGGPELIAAETASVRAFVDEVRREGVKHLHRDPPAVDWLDDWLRLADLRDQHAAEVARDPSSTPPKVPRVDDIPIVERMNEAVPSGCDVPAVILDDFAD